MDARYSHFSGWLGFPSFTNISSMLLMLRAGNFHTSSMTEEVGDSNTIIAHLFRKYRLPIDDQLTSAQRHIGRLVIRMLDDLYWVMSYSRWKDEAFWPGFRDLLKHEHPQLMDESLQEAREFNDQRYYYQGIGRFAPAAAYARGIEDLQILADLIPMGSYAFGAQPTSIDAAIYGFIANIYFLPMERRSSNSSIHIRI